MVGSKIALVPLDILKGINATVWGGSENAKKVSIIVKSGLSIADTGIGVSHAFEDFSCQDYVCCS